MRARGGVGRVVGWRRNTRGAQRYLGRRRPPLGYVVRKAINNTGQHVCQGKKPRRLTSASRRPPSAYPSSSSDARALGRARGHRVLSRDKHDARSSGCDRSYGVVVAVCVDLPRKRTNPHEICS